MPEQVRPIRSDGLEEVLVVENLSVGYGGQSIVNNVHMRMRRGEVTAIVGLNGSGKSTLLKGLAGVLRPIEGRVLLRGTDVAGLASEHLLSRGISYVPQLRNVFPSLSVRENLEMGGYILGSGVRDKIDEICGLFPDLKSALRRPARTLSGGQSHMLAVARGLMVQPTVLLLDEPMAGLALRMEQSLRERIDAVKDRGVAVVLVDQNVRAALAKADWGYVMAVGRNLTEGSGQDLLSSDDVGSLYKRAV